MTIRQIIRIISLSCFTWLTIPAAQSATPVQLQAGGHAETGKNFIYRVKIDDIKDKASFSSINTQLQAIFDNTVRFNEYTGEIIVHSDCNISREKLSKQLNGLGHSLKSYRQVFIPMN